MIPKNKYWSISFLVEWKVLTTWLRLGGWNSEKFGQKSFGFTIDIKDTSSTMVQHALVSLACFLYGQLKHHLACDAKTDYLADTGAIATPHWKLHYSNWSNSIMKLASVAWQYMLSLQSYWSPRLMEWVWKSPFISRSTRGHHLQTCQHSLN